MEVPDHLADILHAAETWAGGSGDRVGDAITGKLCAAVSSGQLIHWKAICTSSHIHTHPHIVTS